MEPTARAYGDLEFLYMCEIARIPPGADDAKVLAITRAYAERGYDCARHQLARRYADGRGVKCDTSAYVRMLKELVRDGDATAAFKYGAHLHDTVGNRKAAFQSYRKAMELATLSNAREVFGEAAFVVGRMLWEGSGVAEARGEAVSHFRLAAETGKAEAQVRLATCLVDGDGCAQDEAEGLRWYSALPAVLPAPSARRCALPVLAGA